MPPHWQCRPCTPLYPSCWSPQTAAQPALGSDWPGCSQGCHGNPGWLPSDSSLSSFLPKAQPVVHGPGWKCLCAMACARVYLCSRAGVCVSAGCVQAGSRPSTSRPQPLGMRPGSAAPASPASPAWRSARAHRLLGDSEEEAKAAGVDGTFLNPCCVTSQPGPRAPSPWVPQAPEDQDLSSVAPTPSRSSLAKGR